MNVDWPYVSMLVGGDSGNRGLSVGRKAVEAIVGERALEEAVEIAAFSEPGADAAESVLVLIRSAFATEYCYSRVRAAEDPVDRLRYMSVLRLCASDIALAWLDSLWADPDEGIRVLATDMLGRIIELGSADASDLLRLLEVAAQSPSEGVRAEARCARTVFDEVYADFLPA